MLTSVVLVAATLAAAVVTRGGANEQGRAQDGAARSAGAAPTSGTLELAAEPTGRPAPRSPPSDRPRASRSQPRSAARCRYVRYPARVARARGPGSSACRAPPVGRDADVDGVLGHRRTSKPDTGDVTLSATSRAVRGSSSPLAFVSRSTADVRRQGQASGRPTAALDPGSSWPPSGYNSKNVWSGLRRASIRARPSRCAGRRSRSTWALARTLFTPACSAWLPAQVKQAPCHVSSLRRNSGKASKTQRPRGETAAGALRCSGQSGGSTVIVREGSGVGTTSVRRVSQRRA